MYAKGKENGLKISMKIVKLLKQKDKYSENYHSFESNSECSAKWIIKCCKERSKLHKALQTGNLKVL